MPKKEDFKLVKHNEGTTREWHSIVSRRKNEGGTYTVLAVGAPKYIKKRWKHFFNG